MLYLVMPDRQMQWTDFLGQEVLDFAEVNGKDLASVDWWKPADAPANDDVVRVAVRYGIPSSRGIVVDAGHVLQVLRPEQMRQTFRESALTRAKAAPQMEAVERFIDENISPGWYDASRELNVRVEESLARSLAEADEDAREEISRKEPNDAVVAHWKSLGGQVPIPA